MDTTDTIREACQELRSRIQAFAFDPELAPVNFASSFTAGRRMGAMMHCLTAMETLYTELLPTPTALPLTAEQEAQEAADRA